MEHPDFLTKAVDAYIARVDKQISTQTTQATPAIVALPSAPRLLPHPMHAAEGDW
jgi:hypothetical protein